MGRPMAFSRRSESGQALLIAVGIFLVLIISIPVIIFVSQTGISHQTRSQRQAEGRAVAEDGIAYAAQCFAANQTLWNQAAQAGNFQPVFDAIRVNGTSVCNSGSVVPGTQFKLACYDHRTYSNLQLYQALVVATAMVPGPNGTSTTGSSIQTVLSQKTMGASLANGVRAAAALSLVKAPPSTFTGLTVHWGPIVCYDQNTWTLAGPLDIATGYAFQGSPRKFSNGGITGAGASFPRSPNATASADTSDQAIPHNLGICREIVIGRNSVSPSRTPRLPLITRRSQI